MEGTACTINLPRNHRNGQFDGRDGVVEGLCHDGRISVRFENNTVFSFDAEHVVLKDQRLSAGTPGYTVTYASVADGAIGRVYSATHELCGTFSVSRDCTVTVGNWNRIVDNVPAAINWCIAQHRQSVSSISFAAKAFGIPA